jgi:hypothetical protein
MFLCDLFYNSQFLDYVVLNGRMTDELERMWKEVVVT